MEHAPPASAAPSARVPRPERSVVLSWVVVGAGALAFVLLAEMVHRGWTQDFDERAVRALRCADDAATPVGGAKLEQVAQDVTALGSVAVLTIATAGVAAFLFMRRSYHAMGLVLAASGGGIVVGSLLKHAFHRERPSIVPHLVDVETTSFPSGHAMLSAAVYLTLGGLLARFVDEPRLKRFFLGLAVLLAGLVGTSRVYLGVHYPSDVLAGWAAGVSWAVLCSVVARHLQRAGRVEPHAAG